MNVTLILMIALAGGLLLWIWLTILCPNRKPRRGPRPSSRHNSGSVPHSTGYDVGGMSYAGGGGYGGGGASCSDGGGSSCGGGN